MILSGPEPEGVRIQKALAAAGVASRRTAERLIAAGRVSVNGAPALVGQRVAPERDLITVDGKRIGHSPPPVHLLLHKPQGVTSTTRGRTDETTVLDFVAPEVIERHGRVYPVGRLDRDSEGLILLTNDGAWADQLLHPRYGVEREYAVGLWEQLTAQQRRALLGGVQLDEGLARVSSLRTATAAEVRMLAGLVDEVRSLVWYRAVLTHGWKRQIRRSFAAVGGPVARLVRVRIGSLRLAAMRPGEVRPLTAAERSSLVARSVPSRHGLVVSLDGPASSGKSSVGAGAASELGYRFCDTGVLYRGLTWLALERGADGDDPDALVPLIGELQLIPDEAGRLRRVKVGDQDVTEQLHSPQVDREVSRVSRHAAVRAAFLPLQRSLAADGRIIMAGRDIGTVVLPAADPKLFIDVSLEERAIRRAAERGLMPGSDEARTVEAELRRRDGIDKTREVAPLRIPRGAIIIRSDSNTLAQTVSQVVATVREREAQVMP